MSTAADGAPHLRASSEQYRSAILDAARALMTERGGAVFTADELARRAGVARRTVFNHFPSVDDVIVAECRRLLNEVMSDFESAAETTRIDGSTGRSVLDEVADALRATDFPTGIAAVWTALGAHERPTGRFRAFALDALTSTSDHLVGRLVRRDPDADPLVAELLAGALTSGIVVITERWLAATGGATDDPGRAVWAQLLERLLESTRTGYR